MISNIHKEDIENYVNKNFFILHIPISGSYKPGSWSWDKHQTAESCRIPAQNLPLHQFKPTLDQSESCFDGMCINLKKSTYVLSAVLLQ